MTHSDGVLHRSMVSNNIGTIPVDEIWVEAGLDLDPSDATSLPISVLYGAGPNTELFLDSAPITMIDSPAGSETGMGDFVFGVHHRILDDSLDRPGFSFDFFTKVPTAENASGLGTGEFDFYLAGSASHEFGIAYVTGYYELGILGEPDASTAIQHRFALSAARAWTREFESYVELASVADSDRAGQEPTTLTLAGNWRALAGVTFDLGLILPLDDDAGDPRVVAGATFSP